LRGPREFSVDLTRQLTERVGADNLDAPVWQLSCTLHWAPSTETDLLASGHLWSFDTTLDEFFDAAVALPGWAWALGGRRTPRDLEISLEEV
jgi:hypothetical protein